MILNHYPPVIKQIKDIQQIAKAEDIEFTKLNTSITEVIPEYVCIYSRRNRSKTV